MANSSGSGFTASIVGGTANYVSADRSNLGMADGVSGAIQYVKLVWGASGEANLVSDQGANPTPLPVSINNAENQWLIDAIIRGTTAVGAGNCAFNVSIINAEGLCFGTPNISLGAGITIFGFENPDQNLGVTFDNVVVGVASGDWIPVRNWVSGTGVTSALSVTGGVRIDGGTVNVSGLDLSGLDFSGGVTINGIEDGVSMPVTGSVYISGTPTFNIGSAQGVTFFSVFARPDGNAYPGGNTGLPVFGVQGATAVGVTFGQVGTTFGTVGATFGTVGATFGTVGATFGTVGTTFGQVAIRPADGGITFGMVLVSQGGSALGLSGDVLKVAIEGAGICFAGICLGIPIEGITLAGGTIAITTVDTIKGGTLDVLNVLGGTLDILGGTLNGILNRVDVGISDWTVTESIDVLIKNGSDTKVPIQIPTGWVDSGSETLKSHLEGTDGLGLKVKLDSGSVGVSGLGFTANQYWGVFSTGGITKAYLGVTIDGKVLLDNTGLVSAFAADQFAVKGGSNSLTSDPVGITLTGTLKNLLGVGISGACAGTAGTAMSVALYGYAGASGYSPIGMSGDALNVILVGGLSGITITGFSFPGSFEVSGGTLDIVGGTLDVLNIPNGVTINGITLIDDGMTSNWLGTTFGRVEVLTPASTSLRVHLTQDDGTAIDNTNFGIPVFGPTGAGSTALAPISATFGTVKVMPATSGITFGTVFTNQAGTPLGLSGTTVVGLPVFGVSGATALGTTFGTVSLGSTVDGILRGLTLVNDGTYGWLGVTFEGTFTSSATVDLSTGVRLLGTTGATGGLPIYPVDYAGNTLTAGFSGTSFIGFPVLGIPGATAVGTTFGFVKVMPATGGITFGTVFTNQVGTPLGLSGATVVGLPVFGVSGATALGTTFGTVIAGFHGWSAEGEFTGTANGLSYGSGGEVIVMHSGALTIKGDSSTTTGVGAIGVTLIGPLSTIGEIEVKTKADTILGVTLGTGPTPIVPFSTGTTFGTVFTNQVGTPLGLSGVTVVGLPVFGVSGATALGVTFGAVSTSIVFPIAGITIASVTPTIGVTLTAHSFAADEGLPIYGVEGATAVSVNVIGGTVSGIFTTEPGGITVTGVSSGIPIFGVSGATAVGVTFGAISIGGGGGGALGVTFQGITFGTAKVNVTNSSLTVSGSVNVGTLPAITANINSARLDDNLNAATAFGGLVVTQKAGPRFARGLTLDNLFIGITNTGTIVSPDGSIVGISGTTVYYLKTTPACVTQNYTGTDRAGTVEGNVSVPLKQGLWVQLTKWDLISHVLVGYTAANSAAFERNAQVLHREYQVAPVMANAMDQFRRFPGYTGNNAPKYNNVFARTNLNAPASDGNVLDNSIVITTVDNFTTEHNSFHPAERQYVGVIEKPSRIFIPCRDAGEVYLQVKGDYANHEIGSGFWDLETGRWSATTLYERLYYAQSFSGFTAGEPDLTTTGSPGSAASNYGGGPAGSPVIWDGSGPGIAIAQILSSYTNYPFIRVWGY